MPGSVSHELYDAWEHHTFSQSTENLSLSADSLLALCFLHKIRPTRPCLEEVLRYLKGFMKKQHVLCKKKPLHV